MRYYCVAFKRPTGGPQCRGFLSLADANDFWIDVRNAVQDRNNDVISGVQFVASLIPASSDRWDITYEVREYVNRVSWPPLGDIT